jgi:hypothetical protein
MPSQFLECNITSIASATTTNIFTGKGFIHTIVSPKATTGTITVNDRSAGPVTLFVLPIGFIGTAILDISVPNGLSLITSAADSALICWMQ